jgi:hypothetical protein
MMRRALAWLVPLIIGALLPGALQSIAVPLPDDAFIGGLVALATAVFVGIAASQLLVLGSGESELWTVLWVSGAVFFVIAVSVLLGAGVFAVMERYQCGAWPAFPVNRDVIGLFALPTALVTFATATAHWPTQSDSSQSAAAVTFTLLIRLVTFALTVVAAALFVSYVEDFAGRWPFAFMCAAPFD